VCESSFRLFVCFEKFDVFSRILDFMELVNKVRGHNTISSIYDQLSIMNTFSTAIFFVMLCNGCI